MLATLKIEGKEFPVEIIDPELQEILIGKKTGYEREVGKAYYYVTNGGGVTKASDSGMEPDTFLYDAANYYSSEVLAKDVARADKLMRQLRRFSVEHRDKKLAWNNKASFYIYFSHDTNKFFVDFCQLYQSAFTIYFDSKEHAEQAIKEYRDELYWYFTEYKDAAEI